MYSDSKIAQQTVCAQQRVAICWKSQWNQLYVICKAIECLFL